MEFRRLGRSGLTVSAIAYGNWHGSTVDDEQVRACLHAALDAGVTTFDTADVYAHTRAEATLGRTLAGQRRESLEILTKLYWPTGPGPNDQGLGRKHVVESAHASLERLRTDYIDVYQAHRYDQTVPLEETMVAFADLVRAGKVRYLGVSEWNADQIRRGAALARELGVPLISNQPQYSMFWRVVEAEVIPAAEREGMGQIAWAPLGQGLLTGKYLPGRPLPTGSRAAGAEGKDVLARFLREEVLERVQRLKPIAADVGLSLAQLAIAWVLRNPHVAAAIVGASRPEQLSENIEAVGVRLDTEVLRRIDQVLDWIVVYDP
ncbi:aldo/keto reductase family protein [Actinophytocola algeriensis]|uniref:Aryl-alcohol dehydrogenase-like predicted oxidoreductase n=1 Tax=Actinophytocola algeriensis TaxID=1768010 RepID=A0A7W7VHV7_9PSEU|nr:aldo/keto reductase family protein [Actinophytocola algeriensis]MBB4910634.1 aryl-alcohol dehydrogenase-like predicted oxidoreductase [Actinophytocola algeriensis]MBE1473627.1 aryl-alcohol dehydrogenase-like predicted oxidoreductase [Actinophytocola algeriensis]